MGGAGAVTVGFVCTNFNNSSATREAIASLHANAGGRDVRAVVVDNRSQDDDVAALQRMASEYPGVEIVLNATNAGYFPGLNIGLAHARAAWPDIEIFVVGNNDLVFPENFVETVERHRDVMETAAVVSPDLVTPEGVHQNPHVRYPISRFRRAVWDVYFHSYRAASVVKFLARATKRLTVRPENAPGTRLYDTAGPIEQGYGACYLIGPAFFRHFTGFFAPTFMMQEEFFLCEQLKSIGQLTQYDPRFVVYHRGHATTDMLPSRRQWEISRDAHLVYKRYMASTRPEQLRAIAAWSRAAG